MSNKPPIGGDHRRVRGVRKQAPFDDLSPVGWRLHKQRKIVFVCMENTVDGRNPANHLLPLEPCEKIEKWDVLHINWCKISSINSKGGFWPKFHMEMHQLGFLNPSKWKKINIGRYCLVNPVPSHWVFAAPPLWRSVAVLVLFSTPSTTVDGRNPAPPGMYETR